MVADASRCPCPWKLDIGISIENKRMSRRRTLDSLAKECRWDTSSGLYHLQATKQITLCIFT